jgi:hypothetical protein
MGPRRRRDRLCCATDRRRHSLVRAYRLDHPQRVLPLAQGGPRTARSR